MENPWADPWNHTQKQDEETDLANPSWSTGAGIRWNEPSDLPALWNHNSTETAPAWIPPKSPYDDLFIGRSFSQSDAGSSTSPVSESHGTIGFHTAPASPKQDSHSLPTSLPPSPILHLKEPTPLASRRSISPDGFGTFESGNTDISLGAWAASANSVPSGETDGDNAWGTAWTPASDPEPPDADPQLDEWEMAKLQKEKQDQHVSPGLLASILQQVKELSNDLWPEPLLDQGETRQSSKDFITDVPGLASAVEMFVPENLVLPPNVQLAKSFTVKHMNEALRLTKHLPMTLSSPLAIYLASKGSTAWEASVKSKQDIHPDDALPPGWRMVQKDKQEASSVPEVKKKAGGLLSFLGLKNTESSTESTSQKLDPSSSHPTSIIGNVKSPRPSVDGSSKPASDHSTMITPPAPISSAPLGLPASDQKTPQGVASQPSAVSRFFGRFSRPSVPSSSQASDSQLQSLSLSSDDIEFLSDIVPSANDDENAVEDFKSLTTRISAKPPRISSLPSPLPPPPKPPSLLPPPAAPSTRLPGSSTKHLETDDPFSLFDNEQPLTSKESKSIESLVPFDSVRQTLSAPNSSTLPLAPFGPSAKSAAPLTVTTMAPSSRAHTPTLAPAIPYAQRRNIMAIMSSDSGPAGSSFQAPLPPAPLPPPPFSTGPHAPQSKPPPLTSLQLQQPKSLFDDDDDFSDFMSSPATTVFTTHSSISPTRSNILSNPTTSTVLNGVDASSSMKSFSSALSSQSLFHSSSSIDGLSNSSSTKSGLGLLDNDITDFVSSSTSTLSTPSPRRPPSKPPTPAAEQPLSGKSLSSPTKSAVPMNRELLPPPIPTKYDHSRTANLVESAATRPGRWPATTSPPPQPIIPPPPPSSTRTTSLDIFGDPAAASPKPSLQASAPTANNPLWKNHAGVQAGNKPNTMSPIRSISPPFMPTRVNDNHRSNSPASAWPSFGTTGSSKPPPSTLKPLMPSTATSSGGNSQKTGGLSAQDLSFFEGL